MISQKVATLLTQMKNGNTNSALGTLEFLNNTLLQYAYFGKLNRYLELKGKKSLTATEKTLMNEIEKIEALKPFISET